ncbi:hypothetical protein [Enterobacter ludwigii]|uniref:hypothetical protein n=1 Tax=Enterobacter ludwigii TaxID=299767 RepID=UPI0039758E87
MKIEGNAVTRGMQAPREVTETNTRSKKSTASEVPGTVLKMVHIATEEMKPTLKKPSLNVQPAAIQEQLAALTGENTCANDS